VKEGMDIGRQESIEVKVTEEMFASFEGEVVHPVYSTVAMVYHMEWVSRKIILPFLNEWTVHFFTEKPKNEQF